MYILRLLDCGIGNKKGLVRSKSDIPAVGINRNSLNSQNVYNQQNDELTWSWNDTHDLEMADIYSWKLKKGADGKIYAVYVIHVLMKSGLKWTVDKVCTSIRTYAIRCSLFPHTL